MLLSCRGTRSCSIPLKETLMRFGVARTSNQAACFHICSKSSSRNSLGIRGSYPAHSPHSSSAGVDYNPLSGLDNVLVKYLYGKTKATEVAHSVWKQVVQKGDTVIDATCGNGHDTLSMLKMVADESSGGCVYGLDIQSTALESTNSMLNQTVGPTLMKHVKLFNICHSKMDEIIPANTFVRLVAFNLGYLPGGNKDIITTSGTTLSALNAAGRILMPGGLISLVVYIGHPGGREELETVEAFASGLSVENWVCCKFQMLNRPLAPILVFIFRR